MTTEPNFGSRTLPTISSTPSARSAIASTETAGGASRVTRSAYAARASSRSARPTTTPPPSDLCSRARRLEHDREAQPRRARPPARAASVTDTATGKAIAGVGEQRPRRVVRRVGDGRRRDRELLGEAGRRGLDEAGQHRARAIDVPVHRDAHRPQHLAGGALRVDRLHDERLALRRDRVGHLVGRGQLRLGEVGLLGRVATEVAGQQHAVDLVGGEQGLDSPGIARDVLLTGAGEVDRVGHRRLRPQRRLELGGDRRRSAPGSAARPRRARRRPPLRARHRR